MIITQYTGLLQILQTSIANPYNIKASVHVKFNVGRQSDATIFVHTIALFKKVCYTVTGQQSCRLRGGTDGGWLMIKRFGMG